MNNVEKLTKSQKRELYVDADQFWEYIKKYYFGGNKSFPLELGMMLEKIANKMCYSSNFIGYTYRDEMASDAKLKMIQVLLEKKFELYNYTLLKSSNYTIKNGTYFIKEYKRGMDNRKNGGCNERGMIIFDQSSKYRPLKEEGNLEEEVIVEKIGNDIYQNDAKIYTFTPEEIKKNGYSWDGICLRTRNIAFGYFSQICKNCYLARIKKEQLNRDIIEAYQEKVWTDMTSSGIEGWDKMRPQHSLEDEEYCDYCD